LSRLRWLLVKTKNVPGAGIFAELICDQFIKAVAAFAQVDCIERHEDAGDWTGGNHRRALGMTARRTATSSRENHGGISNATPPLNESQYMRRWALDTDVGSPDSTSRK